MARPLYCQVEGCENEAAYILTDIDDGATVTMCAPHWTGFLMDITASMGAVWPTEEMGGSGPEPERILPPEYDAHKYDYLADEEHEGPEPGPEPEPGLEPGPEPKRKRTAR